MIETNYTLMNKEDALSYNDPDHNLEDLLEYMTGPNYFRDFGEGLKQKLIEKGLVPEDSSPKECAKALKSKLKAISKKEYRYVDDWFTLDSDSKELNRPELQERRRDIIYEVCFALNFSLEETEWFFLHVYYDIPFNYHSIPESVYYYSFKNGLSYQEATAAIKEINEAAIPTNSELEPESDDFNFTLFIRDSINSFTTLDQLKRYLIVNKQSFQTRNRTARKKIKELYAAFIPPDDEKIQNEILAFKDSYLKESGKAKSQLTVSSADCVDWGLILRDIIYDAEHLHSCNPAVYVKDQLYRLLPVPNEPGNKIKIPNNVLLKHFLLQTEHISKRTVIPYTLSINFPYESIFNDILSKEDVSHDALRKGIIFLNFCKYWTEQKINELPISIEEHREIFLSEMNELLLDCGYNELCPNNPYDWLFVNAIHNENPMEYIVQFLDKLTEN